MRSHTRVPLSYVFPDWLQEPVLPIQIATELRPIVPVWMAAWLVPCLLLALGADGGRGFFDDWPGFFAAGLYSIFCAVMGGNMVGTEYTHGTLAQMLCQPVSRRRLWVRKMGLLAAALLTAGIPLLLASTQLEPHPLLLALALVLVPAINAFCLGPWLSMLTRSALAGSVFSLAVPFLLWAAIQAIASFPELGLTEREQLASFATAMVAAWCAGGLLGYRAFMGLEALDGRGTELRLPTWASGRSSRSIPAAVQPRTWFGQLIRKELRLQQMSLLLAAVFWSGGLIYAVGTRNQGTGHLEYFGLFLQLYTFVMALLVGALTCAEERQFGTLEWHLTCPVKSQTQWLIKVGVALTLTLMLAVVLPAILLQLPLLEVARHDFPQEPSGLALFAGVMLSVTALAIYVSSLSSSTVRALITSAFLAVLCGALAVVVGWTAKSQVGQMFAFFFWSFVVDPLRLTPAVQEFARMVVLVLSALTVGGLLAFGRANFRWADPGFARLGSQILVLILLFGAASSLWAFVGNLH